MKKGWIIAIGVVVLALVGVRMWPLRWDMTDDRRYSLNPATEALLEKSGKIEIESHLTGELNSGMRRLANAVEAMAEEMGARYSESENNEGLSKQGLQPIDLHERTQNGKSVQMEIWPYAVVRQGSKSEIVRLLHNQRGLSGEENINRSIENLEFGIAEAIYRLQTDSVNAARIRVVRGQDVPDEAARFELDQFIMDGGRVLWLVDGVEMQPQALTEQGASPVLSANDELREMLYRYGVRVEGGWIEDRQCVQYPYFFAPLLLTSQQSLITHNLGQVSTMMASPLSVVGTEDSIKREILLASSTASRVRRAPGEIRLQDQDETTFGYAYIPAAMSLEGEFPSAFRHLGSKRDKSVKTKMVIVGTSSILAPAVSGVNNEEFMENALFWLSDDEGLLELRNKVVQLRLLNDQRAHRYRTTIQVLAIAIPLVLLAMVAGIAMIAEKHRYVRKI